MSLQFHTVTIVGVGLLGGSLGLALKARGLAERIRGVGRRQVSLDTARELGAVDETSLDVLDGVRGAGLVVVCTPAALVNSCLDTIRPVCGLHTVVTDVASTKVEICGHAQSNWTEPFRFIGSHPMAGSEKYGPEHATPHLYEGCVTVVEKRGAHAPDAHAAVCSLWQAVGAQVVEMDPATHDAVVACTSHIPHVAAALVARLAGESEEVRALVGQGFRDVTRIAGGRPEIWRDICLTNRAAILDGLDRLAGDLANVRALIDEAAAEGLEAFFRAARQARAKALGE